MSATPQIGTKQVTHRGRSYAIEYFIRHGDKGTILFVHGLGGAKENFWEALKSSDLKNYCLIGFDNPGTGNSTYYEDAPLEVDDLAEITRHFIKSFDLKDFILVGASMGGLTTLKYLEHEGSQNIKAYINIEGNLMPEDCMFSSKVVSHTYEHFSTEVFPQTIKDMKRNGNPGYYVIANNLELNTNVKSYFHYSFQTVKHSSTGKLLQQYLDLNIPRLFIYGERNKNLSYIPRLKEKGLQLKMIPDSDHFVFYDNPKELYRAIAEFIAHRNRYF